MSGYEIATLVLAIVTVLAGVAWQSLFQKSKDFVAKAKKLTTEYNEAVIDGTITDAEKAQMADTAIGMVQDGLDILQGLRNLAGSIIHIVKKK
uniref:Holin n=1 Tax=viral metagenome TaxID=1070528 RepID=A0A6M3IZN1_9ZZZZ